MQHGCFRPEIETASRDELTALQNERLVNTVKHCYANVPYYKRAMDEKGVSPADVRSIEDLWKLPFLSKEDLRLAYPDGMLAVPKRDVVRVHSTSGTTGKRVIAYYTQADLDMWDDCCARALAAAGATPDDVVQICYGFGLFTGGAGINGGSHKLGSMTIPMSSGNTDRQIQFLIDMQATVIACTPSYAAYLAEVVTERGLQNKLHLKSGIFGAEAWSGEMRRDIEEKLGLEAFNIYGLTEMSGPGVAFECEAHCGSHIQEDNFIAEIIDPDTGEVLPDGSEGELVFTTINKQASPLIRYRTHDICTLHREKCDCGRTHVRMGKILGRSDDMLIVKGVNVFPSQIEAVLISRGCSSNYEIIVTRENNSDVLDINVEMTPEMFSDKLSSLSAVEKDIVATLKSVLGIYAKVHLVAPTTLSRSEGKAVRVVDKRGLYEKTGRN